MNKRGIETLVGLFVLLGILALTFIALKAANLASFGNRDGYVLQARFDNIGGLKVRGPVRSAGVLVGRVEAIHFDNDRFQAKVTLALDSHYMWPKDTSASILTSGLLGETYIGLEAGGEDQKLKEGDRITITQSAVVLEKLIGQFLFSKAQETPASAPAPAAGSTAAPAVAPALGAAPKK